MFAGLVTTRFALALDLLTWNRLLVGVILIFDEILNNTLQINDRRSCYPPVCACPRSLTH